MLHDRMLLLSCSWPGAILGFKFTFFMFADYVFDQYLKDSIDEIVKFFESNTVVSQTIALETAAAVQVLFYFF